VAILSQTAPSVEPISTAEAKLHCRVDATDEDTLIAALIVAAREYAEKYTGRALITRTVTILEPVTSDPVELPLPPLQFISSVQTVDETQDATFASASIGSGTNGVVTATNAVAGVVGNTKTLQAVAGVGVGVGMSVAYAAPAITVTLGTDGAGALDPTKNTAILIAAAISASAAGVVGTYSGTGASPITGATGPITFTGGFGTLTTVTQAADEYELDTRGMVPKVTLTDLPTDAESVRIVYTAGYGSTAASVPQAIRQAMLLMVGAWYGQRETISPDNVREVPFAATALLNAYRVQFGGMGVGR
jgi:uncharacterized phiE125 gp8 family phage protein